MKKISKIIFLICITFFGFALNAKAILKVGDLYNWKGYEPCNEKKDGVTLYNNEHHFYNLENASGYCLTPRQPNANTNYKVEEVLDPKSSDFALAIFVAYSKLIDGKYITKTGQNGAVVSTVVRLIAARYGKLSDKGGYLSYSHFKPFELKNNYKVKNTEYFKGKNGKAALKIYNKVLKIMNDLDNVKPKLSHQQKYDALVNNDTVYDEKWNYSNVSVRTASNSTVEVSFKLTSPNVAKKNINWNDFKCGNNCVSLVHRGSGNFTATIRAGVNNFDVITSQEVWKNYDSRIAILKHKTLAASFQPMLVIQTTPNVTNSTVNIPVEGTTYIPGGCGYEVNPNNGERTYYDMLGNRTDAATYRSQCVVSCKQDNDKYICKSTDPDESGKECSEKQYLDECYCPPLKDKCEENPNDPACDEYVEKCPNCNASVSVPGTCGDFDTDSMVTGSISDINQEKTSCNLSVNPVKKCVIDSVDQTNTSYEATNIFKDNKYCKVWCDENYQFDVPTARYSLSGGYFTLSTKVSGTRNCYISSAANPDNPIDIEGFQKELDGLNQTLNANWNEWNKYNTLFESAAVKNISARESNKTKHFKWNYLVYNYLTNSTTTATAEEDISKTDIEELKNELYENVKVVDKQISDSVRDYQQCTSWTNDMLFDPQIDFTYQDYSNQLNNGDGSGKFSRVGEVNTQINNIYCLGDTDNQYNCINSNQKVVANENILPDNIFTNAVSVSCNSSGCTANGFKLSLARWIQKTVTKDASYTPSQNFSTYHQYGTVKSGTVCESANVSGYNNCLWTRLPDEALPVELKTGKGAFPFTLKFSNIGQSNQSDSLGRLVGSKSQVSVLTEYDKLDDKYKCTNYDKDKNGILNQETGYVCAYVNNCPECDVSCDGNNCIIETVKKTCKNCIFDGTNSAFKYRTVSLNNLFPNQCVQNSDNSDCRETGYNWSTIKAEYTRHLIEDEEGDNGENVYTDPEYSFTVNQPQLNALRQFNKDAGSYSNTTMPSNYELSENDTNSNALNCLTYTDPTTGLEYSVKCISTLLNNTTGKYFTSNKPREETTKFTLWQESKYCIDNGNCVLSRVDGIGPSWK